MQNDLLACYSLYFLGKDPSVTVNKAVLYGKVSLENGSIHKGLFIGSMLEPNNGMKALDAS